MAKSDELLLETSQMLLKKYTIKGTWTSQRLKDEGKFHFSDSLIEFYNSYGPNDVFLPGFGYDWFFPSSSNLISFSKKYRKQILASCKESSDSAGMYLIIASDFVCDFGKFISIGIEEEVSPVYIHSFNENEITNWDVFCPGIGTLKDLYNFFSCKNKKRKKSRIDRLLSPTSNPNWTMIAPNLTAFMYAFSKFIEFLAQNENLCDEEEGNIRKTTQSWIRTLKEELLPIYQDDTLSNNFINNFCNF